jgi:hypothetical protein
MSYPSEKRDFERVKINTAVSLSYGTPEKIVEGLCCDLSESGIGIEVSKVLPLGSECRVNIHDGRENVSKTQALIEIKRIQEIAGNRYRIGAIILEKF